MQELSEHEGLPRRARVRDQQDQNNLSKGFRTKACDDPQRQDQQRRVQLLEELWEQLLRVQEDQRAVLAHLPLFRLLEWEDPAQQGGNPDLLQALLSEKGQNHNQLQEKFNQRLREEAKNHLQDL